MLRYAVEQTTIFYAIKGNFFILSRELCCANELLGSAQVIPTILSFSWHVFYSKMALVTAIAEESVAFPLIFRGYLGEIFLGK